MTYTEHIPNQETDSETISQEISYLLKVAENAPANKRPYALRQLAMSLVNEDPFTVSVVADLVKATGLGNKKDFRDAVASFQRQLSQAHNIATKKSTPTDDELASRHLTGSPRRAYGIGQFLEYDEGIWDVIPEDKVRSEIAEVLEAAKPEGVRPSSRLVNSVTELARLKILVDDDKWDADPDYLACKNGTLHIPTREMVSHSPEFYLTSGVPYDYDPEAVANTWLAYLQELLPEAQDFLQEFAGYALTTDTSFEIAVWLYGPPGSGKSTFLTGLQAMLGPRAGLLGLADIERSSFALTNLPGKTLVVATEQPAGYLKLGHVLNAIISGEPIPVDRKYRDPIEVTPRAKIAWAMNELPRVPAGSGLFRRVKVIEFSPLSEERRKPEVKELIKDEGAGILNWALDGLARLHERGRFEVPSCVLDATNQFQENNDVPALFIAEECITGPRMKEQSSELYKAYEAWCYRNGHNAKSSTAIAEDWRRLGYKRKVSNGRRYWHGVQKRLK